MIQNKSFLLPLCLWFFALVCALSPLDSYSLQASVLCVLSIFAFGFTVMAQGLKTGYSVPKSPVLLFAALFWALVLSSAVWSEVKPVTLIYIGIFSVFPVIFLASAMAGQRQFYQYAALAAVPVFALLGLWAMVQIVFLNDYFWGQARHPLADPSCLGGLLSLGLFCALGWMIGAEKTTHKIAALVLSVLLIGGIAATVARGPVFAMIPALAVFTICLWPQIKAARRFVAVFLIVAGLVFTGLQFNPNKSHDLGTEIADTVMLKGDVSNQRLTLWQGTWEMIKDRPLMGTGFGTYSLYIPEYKSAAYGAYVHHAHNDPLQYWAELGVPGPVLFYAFIVAAIIRTIRALKRLRPDQWRERIGIAAPFSALTALVVQAHVSFLLYNLAVLVVAGFVLAVWFYGTRLALREESVFATPARDSAGMTNLIALSLPFLMIGGLYFSVMAGDYYTNKAEEKLSQQDMDGFVEAINTSGHISQGMNYRSYFLAINVPLSILMAEKSSLDFAQRRNLYDQAIGYMETVLRINPRSDSAYFYMAKAQEIAGKDTVPLDAPKQEALYKKSLALNPMNLQSRLALYELYKKENRPRAEQEKILAPAENMFFNTPLAAQYYQLLAAFYTESGNYGKATATMQKMASFQKRSDFSKKRINTPIGKALREWPDKP